MKLKFLYLVMTALLIMLVVGCSKNQDVAEINDTDSYDNVRKIAWEFVVEKNRNC